VEKNELVCKVIQPAVFETNIDDVIKRIHEIVQQTNDNPPQNESEAKIVRADLNRIKKVMDAIRIEVKKQCLKPYEDIEKKFKEIEACLNEPVKKLSAFLNEKDDIRKEKKLASIERVYSNVADDFVKGLVPLKKFMKENWLNVSYKMASIEADLTEAISAFNANVLFLKQTVKPEWHNACIGALAKNLNLGEAIDLVEKLRGVDNEARTDVESTQQEDIKVSNSIERLGSQDREEKRFTYTLEISGTASRKDWEEIKYICRKNNMKILVKGRVK
jgi:hypothetical protein